MKLQFNNNWSVGRYGEQIVEKDCWRRGWRVLDKNWHYGKLGELDIVANDGKQIVFIEVKTRTSKNFGYPVEAINKHKRNKLRMLANAWLHENGKVHFPYRIDSFSVLINNDNLKISHLRAVA
ncbi:MAG: YraN family protein [Bifidobacteriaceae bacterium]|jgi:putative endonuclease|nr:YraN family protein [Bifidobacteriaceae bacterium]